MEDEVVPSINVPPVPSLPTTSPQEDEERFQPLGLETGQTCSICFEPWSNSGGHRIASLKCGHLFGLNCIEKWVKGQGGGKCPQCNAKAKKTDIRVIFAKSIAVVDTTDRDRAIMVSRAEEVLRKIKRAREQESMAKYTPIAYVLWLMFGLCGFHHFYLARYRQGLLWITSFGGLFGIGWLRDFWRLPTYVKDANDDPDFIDVLHIKFKKKSPSKSENWHRLVAQVFFGVFYRGLVYCAIPWESSMMNFATLLIPLGTAFGTYMVSNAGRQKSPFLFSLLGAYIGEFLYGEPHLASSQSNGLFVTMVATVISTYSWDHRRKKESHSCCKSFLVILMVYALFVGLCCSFVYFNASLETEEGETIKVREAIDNFFNSPAWQQLKTAFWTLLVDMYEAWRTDGFERAWSRFKSLADIEGEDHAYDELGLNPETPFKEVRTRYKDLAKEWHPDHHQGEAKERAQEKFIRLNNAYQILDKIHKRRKKYGEEAD